MKIVTASLAALWLCLSIASPAHAGDEFRGKWSLAKSRERGKVQFGVVLQKTGGLSKQVSDWPISAFNVLDLDSSGKREVTFVIEREIGRIECRGFIEGGEGAGSFTFTLSSQYLESLRSRGRVDVGEGEQFAQALRDLALAAKTTIHG